MSTATQYISHQAHLGSGMILTCKNCGLMMCRWDGPASEYEKQPKTWYQKDGTDEFHRQEIGKIPKRVNPC